MLKNNITEQSQQIGLQHPERLSQLAQLAIVGQVILLASAWLLPFVSEYRLVGDNISELVLGRYGFVQTLAFIISGVGTLGLAYAIRQLTEGAWGSLVGSLLVAIYGVGAILVAIFPTDRIDTVDLSAQSTTGTIHSLVSLISFLSVIAGMIILAWTFGRAGRWRSLLPWAAIFATAAVSLIMAQITAQQGPWAGLMQRALVTVIAGWIILVAIRIRSMLTAGEVGDR
ncbi:MAG TPA: DUF998 domain-containing protein [Anaerolineae bacterium]|nr:DUF998 domain-containing protein [Anaerolineae bacterium]HMR67429.1 DUF998 domain-containing protein [Anaerolineae bacterium]